MGMWLASNQNNFYRYGQDKDGYLTWSGNDAGYGLDEQKYLLEYNQAMKQYAEQYALQKEAFQLNKENQAFNQGIAQRQQDLSEESYYNGVVNEAKQLQGLGINPAAQGATTGGATMSGASGVGDVSSGANPSGRNPSSTWSKRAQDIAMLGQILNFASSIRSLDIEQQKVDNQTKSTNASVAKTEAETKNILADYDRVTSEAEYQRLVTNSYSKAEELFEKLHLSTATVQTFKNLDPFVASALGVAGILNAVDDYSFSPAKSDTPLDENPEIVEQVASAVEAYNSLSDSQKSEVDKFYQRNPTVAVDPAVSSLLSTYGKENWSNHRLNNELEAYYGLR